MKKIYVSIDLEGVSGIAGTSQVGVKENALYQEARRLMAMEANAVIEGVNEAGGMAVIGDSHGSMLNIPIEMLKGNYQLSCGGDKMLSMMGGIDETYDGVIFLGYHARFGTPFAVMDHTYSPSVLYRFKINDVEVGEAELNAGIAGYFNVPILMLAGDDTTTGIYSKVFPNIHTVTTKKALGRFSAICEAIEKVRINLRDGSYEVTKNIDKYASLYRFDNPIKMEFTWNTAAMAEYASYMPGAIKTEDRMTVFESNDYIEAFKAFQVQITLAHAMRDPDYL